MSHRKIVEYFIHESRSIEYFSRKINEFIKEGWQPHGNPYLYGKGDYRDHYQAMVKYEQIEEKNSSEEKLFDFWEEANTKCLSYNSEIDKDLINVFKLICEEKYNSDIAKILNLSPQYVEVFQSILCGMGWCSYGSSPRGCWVNVELSKKELIDKLEKWYFEKWYKEEK